LNISIIIPCFNEAENIVDTVNMIINGIDDSLSGYEIILVDDGSQDNSRDLICELIETDERVRAIFQPHNLGKGAALRAGFQQSRMDWILVMDADLQIDISALKHFLPYCDTYDLLIGFRLGRRDSLFRRLFSKIYAALIFLFMQIKVNDINCPFKLIRASTLKPLSLYSSGFFIDTELLFDFMEKRHRIKEIGVNCQARMKGESTVRFRHVMETVKEFIMVRTRRKDNCQN